MVFDTNSKSAPHVELKVNGNEVKLNNFVKKFITHTIIGMVSSLRGVSDISTISLKLSKNTKESQIQ